MKVIYLDREWRRRMNDYEVLCPEEAAEYAKELHFSIFGPYPSQYETDLDRVLDKLNIQFKSLDFKEIFKDLDGYEEVAGLLVKDNNEWYIYTNSKNPAYRQRFTIAHEIGHYYLNHIAKECPNDVIWRDKVSTLGTDPKEKCANAFAAELLMPAKIIESLIEEGYTSHQMAYELGVSVAAIKYRLENLGY